MLAKKWNQLAILGLFQIFRKIESFKAFLARFLQNVKQLIFKNVFDILWQIFSWFFLPFYPFENLAFLEILKAEFGLFQDLATLVCVVTSQTFFHTFIHWTIGSIALDCKDLQFMKLNKTIFFLYISMLLWQFLRFPVSKKMCLIPRSNLYTTGFPCYSRRLRSKILWM